MRERILMTLLMTFMTSTLTVTLLPAAARADETDPKADAARIQVPQGMSAP